MGLNKDEAIVLLKRPFGESDKIIRLFTLTSGKVTAIAKGAGKSQKRFMNTLEPFNHIRIEYFEKQARTMVRIENADVVETNGGIEQSLLRLSAAGYFTEFVDRLTKEREKHPEVFYALKDFISSVKQNELAFTDILFYQLRMLKSLGYLPNFHTCVYCGEKIPESQRTLFSKERGGIICRQCAKFIPCREYPQGIISSIILMEQEKWRQKDLLFEQYASDIMEGFVSFHLELECRSYRILKKALSLKRADV